MRQLRRASSAALAPRVIRSDGAAAPLYLAGYASVFFDPSNPGTEYVMPLPWGDTVVEHLMPGCFDSILAAKPDVRCLFNHCPDHILARSVSGTLRLTADRKGLRYEATVDPSSPAVQSLLSAVERGDVSGSSFSFDFGLVLWREIHNPDGSFTTICEVHSFSNLYDVGPTTYPAYSATTCLLDGQRSAPPDRSRPFIAPPGRRYPRSFSLPGDPARRRAAMLSRLIEVDSDQ